MVDTIFGTIGNDLITPLAPLLQTSDNDDLVLADSGDDTIDTAGGNDFAVGEDGNDTITGGSGENILMGGDGNDSIIGGDGTDIILGDTWAGFNLPNEPTGADDPFGQFMKKVGELFGVSGRDKKELADLLEPILMDIDNTGKDTVFAGGGNDLIFGGALEDSLAGGLGNDYIEGGTENDILDGGAGIDRLFGEDGDDILAGGADADSLDGGAGSDTADYSGSAAAVNVFLDLSLPNTGGDAEGDTLISIENLIGSDGDDSLVGDSGENTIAGGAGADTIEGGAGEDTADYSTSATRVTVFLGSGTPNFGGDAEGDVLSGIEHLIGSNSGDNLLGDEGANTIAGGAGNDVLVGELGSDSLDGGQGLDILSGVDGGVTDILNGGSERDIAYYFTATTGQVVDMADHTNGATNSGEHVNDIWIDIEGFFGARNFSNTITGDARDNDLFGGNQADVISGGAGVDLLLGLRGNDVLNGGTGDDVLIGGRGTDTLTGDAGADFIYVHSNSGIDIVTDWNEAEDSFLFAGIGASNRTDLTFTDMGTDVEITYAAEPTFTVVVQNAELTDLDSDANYAFF